MYGDVVLMERLLHAGAPRTGILWIERTLGGLLILRERLILLKRVLYLKRGLSLLRSGLDGDYLLLIGGIGSAVGPSGSYFPRRHGWRRSSRWEEAEAIRGFDSHRRRQSVAAKFGVGASR